MAVVVAGLVAATLAWGDRGRGPDVTFSARPLAYRVVYRTAVLTGGQVATRWESLTVVRPFAAADLTYGAAPTAGSRPLAGYVATAHALYDVDGTGLHLVGDRQPGVPPGDQDLATQLPELQARKLAADTGSVRTVAGRRCAVWRFLEPPSGPVKPLAGASGHDDLCIDGAGIVLSEAWTYGGRLVLTRQAEAVALSAAPLPPVPGAGPAASSIPTLVPDASPRTFLTAPPAPPGYRGAGSFDYRVPAADGATGLQASSVVWAFVDGADVVTVEAGTEAGGGLPWGADQTSTRAVTLAGLGPAQTAIRADGAEVEADLGGGRWVRVRGTEPAPWLAGYAGRLRPAAG